MWYYLLAFIVGSYSGRVFGDRTNKYYESICNSQQNEINKYKRFLADKNVEEEFAAMQR